MRSLLLFSFLFFNTNLLFTQNQASLWYFGNGAGLDFSSGAPRAIIGELYTNEGCAIAVDHQGKLLFYTDGVTVWDSNHDTIYNGINLGGGKSSTQSAVIVENPSKKNLYYIFTVAEQAKSPGLTYSIVDISLRNGKGAITEKNIPLLSPVSEKLTTVKHCNDKWIWVITHEWGTSAFYSYLISEKGVEAPVISHAGLPHQNYGTKDNSESIGYLKASPDGKRLACAISKINLSNVHLFDFNSSSGKVTNPVSLSAEGNAYGVSFSPDNTRLYVSFDAGPAGVIQYDLTVKDIRSSLTVISSNNKRHGAMQTGPDGKIYIASASPFLHVINQPNAKGGNCRYQEAAIDLKGKYSTFGLPSFNEHIVGSGRLDLGRDTLVCDSKFFLESRIKSNNYLWSTQATTPSITINKSGKYWLKITEDECMQTDTIQVILNNTNAFTVDLGKDTSVCGNKYFLDAKNEGAKYLWSTGDTTQKISVAKSKRYWVKVTKGNCAVYDSINIQLKGEPVFIPVNEFTPNNGGFNETFDYIVDNITEFDLKILRRGKIVFKTNDPNIKWKGYHKKKIVPAGTYQWTLKYKSQCMGNKRLTKRGEVKVLRVGNE